MSDKKSLDEILNEIRKEYNHKFKNVKIWRKGNKERIYLDQSYMTKDENDVFGKNWDYAAGWYIQYDRPGHWNVLKEIAETLKEEVEDEE